MRRRFAILRGRPFLLYLSGLGLIFAGAWAMAEFHSMVPMALAASAGLMLVVPLVRRLWRGATPPTRR